MKVGGVIFVFSGMTFGFWVSTSWGNATPCLYFLTFSDSIQAQNLCKSLAGVRWFRAYLNHMRNLNKKYNSGDVDYEYHHIIKGLYTTCSSWHIDSTSMVRNCMDVYTPPVHRGI